MYPDIKNYPALNQEDVRIARRRAEGGVERSLLVVQTPFGYRRVAELFRPEEAGTYPILLFIHWYETWAPNSNRTQFVEEARELAARGAVCLTVETMWSDPDYFTKRTQADDMRLSVEEVVNLRRFMDLLAAQPGADPRRFALVGHDFGGMYGLLAGRLDGRPTHYVVMAATPRFPDWFLYAPAMEGEAREAFIESFKPLDPITMAPELAPAPILFQFGTDDPHVPRERAGEFFEAARPPKEAHFYESGHHLNEAAGRDRRDWLVRQLGLA